MAISDTLLSFASGAADVINKDAESDRDFMRKQRAKIAESRMVRQEKDYDKRKTEWDNAQKYGTDKVGQYMHAFGIFKDHAQATKAMNDGIFASTLKGFKNPGQFTPYEVAITNDDVLQSVGDTSIAGKIMGRFGKVKTRRAEQRSDQAVVNNASDAELAVIARQAAGVTDPTDLSPVDQSLQELGIEPTVATTTGAGITGEEGFFETPRSLEKPQLQYIPAEGKSMMLQWDPAAREYVAGDDTVFKATEIGKVPEADKRKFDRLSNLRNIEKRTPREEEEHNFLINDVAPWKFNTVDIPGGGTRTELFRVDPLTNERVTIAVAGKSTGDPITISTADLQFSSNYIKFNVSSNTFNDNIVAGIGNLSDDDLQGLHNVLSTRAKEYLAGTNPPSQVLAYELALKDLNASFTTSPTSFLGFSTGSNTTFDMKAAFDVLETPLVTRSGLMEEPKDSTVNTLNKPTTRQEKEARLLQLQQQQAQQQ
jgi:hypothetical protein